MFYEQPGGHEIPVGKPIRNAKHVGIVGLEHGGKLTNRHGRHEKITRYAPDRTGRVVLDADGCHCGRVALNSNDAVSEVNIRSAQRDLAGDLFPHLAGTEFWIKEALDQAGLRALLCGIGRGARETRERVHYRFRNGESFDALSAPFRRYLLATDPPDFFGIVLEKSPV